MSESIDIDHSQARPATAGGPEPAGIDQGLQLALALKQSGEASLKSFWQLIVAEVSLSKTALLLTLWLSLIFCAMAVTTWIGTLAFVCYLLISLGIEPLLSLGGALALQLVFTVAIYLMVKATCARVGLPGTTRVLKLLLSE